MSRLKYTEIEPGPTIDDVCIAAKLTKRILAAIDSSSTPLGIACSMIHWSKSFCDADNLYSLEQ